VRTGTSPPTTDGAGVVCRERERVNSPEGSGSLGSGSMGPGGGVVGIKLSEPRLPDTRGVTLPSEFQSARLSGGEELLPLDCGHCGSENDV